MTANQSDIILSMTHLKEGCQAPLFRFKDEYGKEKSLADLKGKKIILYFYPKDLTPGCSVQACNLRDNYTILRKKGFFIIGISGDNEKLHARFTQKFDLPFPLIPDVDLNLVKAYGVWGPKKFMGREYDGIHRTTFIIDEKGKIESIIQKVKTKDHTNQILQSVTTKN